MKDLQDLNPLDYLSIFWRRIWYAIVVAVAVSAAAIVYAKGLPLSYKSMGLIQVTGRVVPEDYIRSLDRETANDLVGFVRQQLQSRTFLQGIVKEFKFGGDLSNPKNLENAVDAVRNNTRLEVLSGNLFRLGFVSGDPSRAQAVATRLVDKVIQLNDSGRKKRVENAEGFIDEQYREAETKLSTAEVALALFRERHGITNVVASQVGLEILKTQLTGVDSRLDSLSASRRSLEQRMSEQRMLRAMAPAAVISPASVGASADVPTPTVPRDLPAAGPTLEDRLARKQEELAETLKTKTPDYPGVATLMKEVKDLEAAIADSRKRQPVVSVPPRTTAPPVAKTPPPNTSPAQASLEQQLFEADARLLIEQVEREVSKEEQTRKELQSRISLYEFQLNLPRPVAQELASLTSEHEAALQSYKMLRDKKLSLEMTARVDVSAENELFKILDPPYLPPSADGPNRRLYAAAGTLAGILLGLGVAFLRDYVDPTIRDEEEAAELGLTVLTSIPDVKTVKEVRKPKSVRARRSLSLNLVTPVGETEGVSQRTFGFDSVAPVMRSVVEEPTIAGEQFRLMRVSLSMLQKERSLKTILVASAIPKDGKTFVASCLAGMLAQEPGKKVLLIDADLRAASSGEVIGVGRGRHGLSELLQGSATLDECILNCTDTNLTFLPAGPMVDKPTELLGTPQLEQCLREVQRLYDWIVIDSPPVLALADAKVIAALCDTTILVVNSRRTPKSCVKEMIKRIGKEKVCGIVLNQIQRSISSPYYSYSDQQVANHKPSHIDAKAPPAAARDSTRPSSVVDEIGFTAHPEPVETKPQVRSRSFNLKLLLIAAGIALLAGGLWFFKSQTRVRAREPEPVAPVAIIAEPALGTIAEPATPALAVAVSPPATADPKPASSTVPVPPVPESEQVAAPVKTKVKTLRSREPGSLAVPPTVLETPKQVSPSATRFYTVQVSAFGSSDNAETLVVELKTKFTGVFVDKAPSGTYRVRVGRLVDQAAARQLQSKLTEQGFDSFVVLAEK